MLLTAAVKQEVWWIAIVIVAGGVLAGGYVLRVVIPTLQRPAGPVEFTKVPLARELTALGLALMAFLLGFIPLQPLGALLVGRP